MGMNKEIGIAVILGICVLVLLIGLLKRKAGFLLNFVVRVVVGGVAIYGTNQFFLSQGSSIAVGINPTSLITIGLLGFGGYGLLYGIIIYQNV